MYQELNDIQLSFWRAWRAFPQSPINHRSMKIEWRIVLDVDAFGEAVKDLVDSTDALRLCFEERDGTPFQYAAKACDPDLVIQDFSDGDCPIEDAVNWLTAFETDPFELTDKAFFMALAKVADDHWIWLLNQHHIVTDFTSSANLINRLSNFYNSRKAGVAPEATKFLSFLDFHQREVSQQSSITFESGQPPRLHPVLTYNAKQLVQPKAYIQNEFHLGPERLERFRSSRGLSKEDAGPRFIAPLYELVLATTFAFMNRVSGQVQPSIGTLSHGRFTTDSSDIIGPLIRTLPISIDIPDVATCTELLTAVKAERKQVFRAVRHGKEVRGKPVNVFVNFIPETMPAFAGVQSREITRARPTEDISRDLSITVRATDTPGDVKFLFDLCEDVAGLISIDVMKGIFLKIFDAFIDNASCKIDEIPIYSNTDMELERARADLALQAPPLPYFSLVEGFLQQVAKTPCATAVIDGSRTLTFAELEQRSRQVAYGLLKRGIVSDHIVALRLPRSAELIITLLGVLRAGAGFIALDKRIPEQRTAFMLSDSGARFIVLPKDDDLAIEDVNLQVLEPGQLMDEGKCQDFELPIIDPRATMYLVYTSGTTGTPKGIKIPHDGFARYFDCVSQILSPSEPITFALATTLTFDPSFCAFMALTTGGAVVTYQAPDELTGVSIVQALNEDRVDGMTVTPSQLRYLSDTAWSLSRLKYVMVIGEGFQTELAQRAQKALGEGVRIYNEYGTSETTMATSLHLFDAKQDLEATVPVGIADTGSTLHVLDAKLQPLPDGVIGEICIGGVRLSNGYLNQPELTAQKFLPDPFRKGGLIYRTGDLGRYNPKGQLVHHGRIDDQVKINGVRAELGEIEAGVSSHADVEKCAVLVNKEHLKQIIAFYVAPRAVPEAELRASCEKVMARNLIPQQFVRIEAIPFSPTGKIDRQALLSHIPQKQPEAAETYKVELGPQGATEFALASIWCRVLKLDAMSRSDSFFDLGGDSLSFLQMILMVEAVNTVSLTAQDLTGVVSIQQLGQLIDKLPKELNSHERQNKGGTKAVPHLLKTGAAPSEVRRQISLGSIAWSGTQLGTGQPVFGFNMSGAKPPLFWCFNDAKEPNVMAEGLGADQPLYSMRSMQGVIEREHKEDYLDEIATGYAEEIVRIQPKGPYYLGGNCQSGRIADNIARTLLRNGHAVAHIFLLEYEPKTEINVGVSLFYGAESKKYNPFLNEDRPELRLKELSASVSWDIIPGNHGQYFQPHIAPKFIERLSHRLEKAQQAYQRVGRLTRLKHSVSAWTVKLRENV